MKTFSLSLLVVGLVSAFAQMNLAHARYTINSDALSLPPPPAEGSSTEKQDFKILHKYEDTRTTAECKAADKQSFASTKALFGPATGILSTSELEAVEEFGDEVIETVLREAQPFKEEHMRPRPYDADRTLTPCIRRPGGSKAYPSSHASMGVVLADLFAKIYPAKKTKILAQGQRIGEFRVLGGVHHPSDIEAGRNLGKQILRELGKVRSFRTDFEALLRHDLL